MCIRDSGMIGKERKIGFGLAFFLAVLLSPVVGFVFVLSPPGIKDEEYQEKMLEMAENKSGFVLNC